VEFISLEVKIALFIKGLGNSVGVVGASISLVPSPDKILILYAFIVVPDVFT